MAAAEAVAAKRKKILTPKPSVATVADPSLPAGVGIMGRGRAAVNAPLTSDGSTVQALQQRRTSMPGCQTLSIGTVASWCTTRNHMVGAERVRMLIGSLAAWFCRKVKEVVPGFVSEISKLKLKQRERETNEMKSQRASPRDEKSD